MLRGGRKKPLSANTIVFFFFSETNALNVYIIKFTTRLHLEYLKASALHVWQCLNSKWRCPPLLNNTYTVAAGKHCICTFLLTFHEKLRDC